MQQPIVTSAPASTMLFGEHAIFRGSPGIIAAIDRRLEVRLTPILDSDIVVVSDFGTVQTNRTELAFGPSFRFVEAAFRLYASKLPAGAHLEIISSINPNIGLGSSASVTVAVLAALQQYVGACFGINKEELLQQSCQVIKSVQGFGSGADAASIIYGGIISYDAATYVVQRLADTLPLILVYSGYKTPTPEVIKIVNEFERKHPSVYRAVFSAIAENATLAASAIRNKAFDEIGMYMNQAQGLMQALGVGTPKMTSIWLELSGKDTIYGAKISGSGLGDCVIGLGEIDNCITGSLVSSKVSQEGVLVHG